MLKKLLLKFISNTQVKEMKDLHESYTYLENEKRELETKNKKYQEFLSTVLKEKEEKDQRINDLTKELERTKRLLADKDKKLNETERRLREKEAVERVEKKRSRMKSI